MNTRVLEAVDWLVDAAADQISGNCMFVTAFVHGVCARIGVPVRSVCGRIVDDFGNDIGHIWSVIDGELFDATAYAGGWTGTNYREEGELPGDDLPFEVLGYLDDFFSVSESATIATAVVDQLLETAGAHSRIDVPAEPGTVPVPNDHLRLYHYTSADPAVLKSEGLLLSRSKGLTYGEPQFVWASLKQPGDHKTYVEFSVPIDDPRFSMFGARPDAHRGVEFYRGRSNDFTLAGDVSPSEFIAVHEPWHRHYRYMVENGFVAAVLAGEHDDLTADQFPDEAKAVQAVKANFSA